MGRNKRKRLSPRAELKSEQVEELIAFGDAIGRVPIDVPHHVRIGQDRDGNTTDNDEFVGEQFENLQELCDTFVSEARPLLRLIGEKVLTKERMRTKWFN